MSQHVLRRAALLAAVPALTLTALAALPSSPASAAEPDPAPVTHGAAWLDGQLTDGLIHNEQYDFDDYGLSIDAGLALEQVGGYGTDVGAISAALAANIGGYVGDGTTESYAGALGKAAVFARIAGDDPASYGGVDLVTRLEARVGTTGPTAGRVSDASAYGDFANPIGQAFAVRALDEAGSSLAASATDFLLVQQCADGAFRAAFSDPSATDQSCDGDDTSVPSVDVTALAVLQLEGQGDDAVVQRAIDDAVTWLVSVQNADGSFGGAGATSARNANSTGLAGWALGDEGATAAATRAAVWLRGRQADDFGPCTTGLTGATGAIAYDGAALASGRENGIKATTQDQFRRATAQALPALAYAPAGTYASEPVSSSTLRHAGRTVALDADHLAPGQTVCFARNASQDLTNAGPDGHAVGRVVLPAGTGARVYTVGLTDGVLGKITVQALDATNLPVSYKKTVTVGYRQVVRVSGLHRGERAHVVFGGRTVASGVAGRQGRFKASFPIGRARGQQSFHVIGQFVDRKATKTFTVTP